MQSIRYDKQRIQKYPKSSYTAAACDGSLRWLGLELLHEALKEPGELFFGQGLGQQNRDVVGGGNVVQHEVFFGDAFPDPVVSAFDVFGAGINARGHGKVDGTHVVNKDSHCMFHHTQK